MKRCTSRSTCFLWLGCTRCPTERPAKGGQRGSADPRAHKTIGQLSKGRRQRVGPAQALLHDPEVLILDEPTSGLDPNQLVDIRTLIRSLGKDRTVVLSTHIMQEVEPCATGWC